MLWSLAFTGVALCAMACSGAESGITKTNGDQHGMTRRLPLITFITAASTPVPLAVEVADDDTETRCGLMHRTELSKDQGMIFAYPEDAQGGFYMRNTLIPLSIAFVTADGTIIDIFDMEPVPAVGHTPWRFPDGQVYAVRDGQGAPPGAVQVIYTPRAPYRYAIEVNQGWFAQHGISVGHRVETGAAVNSAEIAAPPPLCAQYGM